MEENQSFLELQVDQQASANLNEVSRWGKFFGLIVLVGMLLLFVLFTVFWTKLIGAFNALDQTDSQNVEMVRIVMIIVFVIVGVIVGIMMSFLIKGANRIRTGIRNKDQMLFNSGLANLKNYFAMYGVIAIIGIFFALIGLLNQ
ncbi:MAG: hypothetical protein ABIR18_00280 [Chitinophagaceae bacterium]